MEVIIDFNELYLYTYQKEKVAIKFELRKINKQQEMISCGICTFTFKNINKS